MSINTAPKTSATTQANIEITALSPPPEENTIEPPQPEPTYPLSLAQTGIWLGQQITPNAAHYNTAELMEFSSVDSQRLLKAINNVLKNCAPLNTRFFAIDGNTAQTLVPHPQEEITHGYDASLATKFTQESPLHHAIAWANQQLSHAIALDKEPPYRSTLIKLGENHYAWFLMIHHIACDGFSYSIIGQHVAALYRAPHLPAKVQWKKSVEAYQKLLTADHQYQYSEDILQDKNYWLTTLANKPAPVTLSKKSTTTLDFTQRSLRVNRIIPQAWLNKFQSLCLKNSTTQQACHWAHGLNALVAAFIFQHTGSGHINLGQPVMNRMGSTALKVPAMVMNIVPLPIDFSGVNTFNALIKKVCEQLNNSKSHNRYRYEQLNAELKTQAQPSSSAEPKRAFGPVVNVMPFDRAPKFGNAIVTLHPLSAGPVEDIAFSFALTNQGDIHFSLEGNPTRYQENQLNEYVNSFLNLSESIILQQGNAPLRINRDATSWLVGPKRQAPSPSVLSALYQAIKTRSHHTALEYFDNPETNDNDTRTTNESSAENSTTALTQQRQEISYEQLGIYIVDCAQTLAQQGVHNGDRVIVALPRGPWSVVICFACLALDAQFIFIDPAGPKDRNQKIISDAQPKVIICDTQHRDNTLRGDYLTTETKTRIVALESIKQFATHSQINAVDFFEHRLQQAENKLSPLAYGIYTSGSTGQPKGVMVDQKSLNDFILSANQEYQITAADRVLHFAPMHFDTCIEEIFIPLCVGATLVIRNDDMIDSMAAFNASCEELSISVLDLPTAFWHEWVFYCSQSQCNLPSTLHTLIIGGEAALEERVRNYQKLLSTRPIKLLNTYAPSEATVVASVAQLGATTAISSAHTHQTSTKDNPASTNTAVSIGLPLSNRELLIVKSAEHSQEKFQKPNVQLALRGEDGELVIAGQSLARGYLNNDALTLQYFTELDFGGAEPPLSIYRTGDRARINSSGNIEYLGRIDNEVKISGQRINPAEIESILLQEIDTSEVAVVIAEIQKTETSAVVPRIIAYIAINSFDNDQNRETELRTAIAKKLPAVMMPYRIIFCEKLPKNPAGKIDKKKLLLNFQHDNTIIHQDVDSRKIIASPLEKSILIIWQEILGEKGFGVQDDFFMLGGQSLQLLQIATRLSTQLQCNVPVSLLFQHPTANRLARALTPLLPKLDDNFLLSTEYLSALPNNPAPSDGNEIIKTLCLPSDFPPVSKNIADHNTDNKVPANIFLTGANGFVGIQLLHHLLTTTTANITCLIRAQSQQHAWEKIAISCRLQTLPALTKNPRITLILGSIEEPQFGLSQADYHRLAETTDAVVHNAAITSIVRNYNSLAAANVTATVDCLHLAAKANATLHYVSTIAVGGNLPLPEKTIAWHDALHDGYQQSKWASESLITQAEAFGVQSCIYRLPRVVGELRTGFINTKDLVWKIIAASERTKALPITAISEPWLPVNIAANIICKKILSIHAVLPTDNKTQVINCVPQDKTHLNTLFQQLAPRYKDHQIAMPVWLERLALSEHAEDQALLAFFQQAPKKMALSEIKNNNFYRLLKTSIAFNAESTAINFEPYIVSAEKQGLIIGDTSVETSKVDKRTPPRLLKVQACSNPHPQIRRIILSGETLRNFPVNNYGGHIKIFVPRAHQIQPLLPTLGPKGPIWPTDDARPITRTYSVRYYNPVNNTLAIDFVMHKHLGPAANWAQKAKPGDLIGVAGPGGPNPLLAPAQHHIIAGDLTALPAIQATVEALPSTSQGAVFIAGECHGLKLQHNTKLEIHWLEPQFRDNEIQGNPKNINTATRISEQVLEAIKLYVKVANLKKPPLTNNQKLTNTDAPLSALVAGENSLVLTVRDYLRTTFQLPKALLYAVPYWRNGQDEEGYHQQRHTIMDEEY